MAYTIPAYLVFRPLSERPALLLTEDSLKVLPVRFKKGVIHSSDDRYVYLSPFLASVIYSIETDKPVIYDRKNGKFYEVQGVLGYERLSFDEKTEKEKFKAYETPPKTLKLIAETTLELIKQSLIEVVSDEDLKREILEVPREEILSYLQKNARELFEKTQLLIFNDFDRLKELKLVFFDPQAGSGRILEFLPKNAILFGFEIRNLKVEDPRYQVLTGVDSSFAFDVLEALGYLHRPDFPRVSERTFADERTRLGKLLKNAFWLVNPPYDQTKKVLRETMASVPKEAFGFYLLSLVDGRILIGSRVRDFIYSEATREKIGYEEEETPERFCFAIGYVSKGFRGGGDYFYVDFSRIESPEEIAKILIRKGTVKPYEFLRHVLEQSRNYEAIKELKEKVIEEGRRIYENLKEEEVLKKVLDTISIRSLAYSDKSVFPALHYYENGILVSFKDVAGNPELLKLYKEKFPEVYEVLEDVSKRRAFPLALVERGTKEEYVVTSLEKMGIMKFKYLPSTLKLTPEVKEVLLELLKEEGASEEELRRASFLLEVGKEIWVKNKFSSTKDTGEETFGYAPVLAITDEYGKTLGRVGVSLKKFLDRLVEKGIIEIKAKPIEEHPGWKEAVEKVIRGFVKDVRNAFSEEERRLIEEKKEVMKSDQKVFYEVVASLNEARKKRGEDFASKLYKLSATEEALESVYKVLKARGKEELKSTVFRFFKELSTLFEKYPTNFVNNLYVVRNEGFAKEFTSGLPVIEYARANLSVLLEGEDEILIKDLVSAYVSKIDLYREIINSSTTALARLTLAYLHSEDLERHLEEGKIEEAEKLFRTLHLKVFKLLPHQYEEGIRVAIKSYLTGESGHVLGWEMRSGKTLAMTLASYFATHLFQNQAFIFCRSANLFDVTRQILRHLPHVASQMVVIPSQELYEKVFGEVATLSLPFRAFPNVFSETSLFKGKGTTAKRLLEERAFRKIELYAKEEFDLSKIRGKPYEGLLYLEGFDKDLLKGLVRFIYENEEKFTEDRSVWRKFIEKIARKGRRLKERKEGRVYVISKETHLLSLNYALERDRREVGKGIYVNADVTMKELSEVEEVETEIEKALGDYYVLLSGDLEELGLKEDAVYFAKAYDPKDDEEEVALYLVSKEKLLERGGKEEDYVRASDFYKALIGLRKGRVLTFVERNLRRTKVIDASFPFLLPVQTEWGVVVPNWDKGKGKTNVRVEVASLRKANAKPRLSVLYELEDAPPVYDCLTSNKRDVVFASSSLDGHVVVVDEVDQSSSHTSEQYKVIKAIKSPLKIAATGTISNGTVQSIAELLGMVSPIRYDALEKLIEVVKETYGTWTITEKDKGMYKVFFNAFVFGKHDEEFLESFYEIVKYSNDPRSFLRDFKELARERGYLLPQDEEVLLEFIYADDDELRGIGTFLKSLRKEFSETYSTLSFTSMFQEALFKALRRIGALKEGVGTLNPIGLVKIMDLSVSISLNTREMLKGVKEELIFEDEEVKRAIRTWERTREWTFTEEEKCVIGSFEPLEDVSHLFSKEKLEKLNTLRRAYDYLNRLNFDGNSPTSSLRKKFNAFLTLVSSAQEVLMQDYPELVSRSGISTEDDLTSLIREYLLNGGWEEEDLEELLESDDYSEKREFALKVLKALEDADFVIEKEEGEEKVVVSFKLNGKRYECEVRDYEFISYLRSGGSFTGISQEKFSILLDLASGRNWDERLFKEESKFLYNLKLVSAKEDEVVDVISNKGYVEEIKKDLLKGKNLVITPSRIPVLPLVVVDVLNCALHRNQDTSLVVIVRRTTPEQEKFLRKLDREFLKERGITLKVVSSQAELDAEVQRLKGYDAQAIVIAPAQTVSRGVDFSYFDVLYVLGTLDGKGREFTQLLARLFSPHKNTARVKLFGTPTKLLFVQKNGFITGQFRPNYTALIQARLIDKANFSKDVLSGELRFLRESVKVELLPDLEEEYLQREEELVRYKYA